MDPCPFVRLVVESLALKLPPVAKIAVPGAHPSSTPCSCSIHLQDFPAQTAPLPLSLGPTSSGANMIDVAAATSAASTSRVVISLDPAALQRMSKRPAILTVVVYAGRSGKYACALASGRRLLGQVRVAVDLEATAGRAAVVQSGWVSMGSGQGAARLHLVVRTEPDPRFVFQFGGEPECSPVVYQIQGAGGSGGSGIIRQPVFSCRFSAARRQSGRPIDPADYCERSSVFEDASLVRSLVKEKPRCASSARGGPSPSTTSRVLRWRLPRWSRLSSHLPARTACPVPIRARGLSCAPSAPPPRTGSRGAVSRPGASVGPTTPWATDSSSCQTPEPATPAPPPPSRPRVSASGGAECSASMSESAAVGS
ncbi:uncharacterized protein LOC122033411 isoform X2 [Zingiber officinale]|uniref:uncharacterized protein LOC122033411 isoform X2 n=1 Tax=Zingiber officinale TaxID=94328 RepID=UPI001C4BC28D|nr:uncharacterized protein LOC122033411 isoform X2 [Zingiber officinale]